MSASWSVGELDCRRVCLSASWFVGELSIKLLRVRVFAKVEPIKTALAHAYRTFRSSGGPRFAVIGLLRPQELTCKYNSMLTYIPVSFLFSFKNFLPVRVKIGLGLG